MPNARIFRYRLLRSTPSASAVRDMLPCCAARTRKMYCCSNRSRAVWSGSTSPSASAATCSLTTSRFRNATSLPPITSPATMIMSRSITFRSSRTLPGHAYRCSSATAAGLSRFGLRPYSRAKPAMK
jgi:hypothetical protein